jgi:hypothetical protein
MRSVHTDLRWSREHSIKITRSLQNDVKTVVVSRHTFLQDAFLQDAFLQDAFLQDAFPQDTFPQDTFPQDTFPQDTFPQDMASLCEMQLKAKEKFARRYALSGSAMPHLLGLHIRRTP